jgi:tetratricopeptide (TPR) repeat protein
MRIAVKLLALVPALCLLSLPALTWGDETQALACAEQHAPLIAETGSFSRDINSDSAMAQAYFDQGLRLTYSYYFPEAIASFNAALCLDPDNAMIHWGRALAIGPNPNSRNGGAPDDPTGEGARAIARAQESADQRPLVERGLIAALAALFDDGGAHSQSERTAAMIAEADALYTRFPDDQEVAFLLAHAIMMSTPWDYYDHHDGLPRPGVARARQALEEGMAVDESHPGLTHLHIHLMEASPEPWVAEASADRLESLTPKAGHMVHMPGHIYMRLGRYDDAISANERSLAADQFLAERWGERGLPREATIGISHRVHGGHASHFIHWAYLLQGQREAAVNHARMMANNVMPQALAQGAGLRQVASYWMTLRAFGDWDAIIAMELPDESLPYLRGVAHHARGSALVALGDTVAAEAELSALRGLLTNPVLLEQRAAVNTAADMLNIAERSLAGEIAAARGHYEMAIAYLEEAVSRQDALRYMEPPDWILSTRLYLGQVHLDAGQPQQAEAVFRRDLELLMENGRALFGLAQALREQGRIPEANAVRNRYVRAWRHAETPLVRAHH